MLIKKLFIPSCIIFSSIIPSVSLGAQSVVYGRCSETAMTICLYDSDCPNGEICVGSIPGTTVCSPLNCVSTDWSTTAYYGYESRENKYCSSRYVCTSETQYRCMQRFYGSPTALGKGCTICPMISDFQVLSDAGSTKITDCYIPSDVEHSDESGNFLYTTNCHYSE